MNSAATDAAVMSPKRRMLVPLLLFVVAGIIYAGDQFTKNWVERALSEGQTVQVFGDFLQWHFVRNPGAAFSMASGQTWIFTILATVVTGVILWQLKRLRSVPWALFLGLLLGGVLGNLTDRLLRQPGFPEGHVVDFISTPWMMPAIYNVADIGIVGGMILFVLLTLFGLKIEGGRYSRKSGIAAAEAEATAEADADAGVLAEAGAEVSAEFGSAENSAENSAEDSAPGGFNHNNSAQDEEQGPRSGTP